MELFDGIDRNDNGPSAYAEDLFSYLNRSARPIADSIRKVLELWFTHYNADEQAELRNRFRSEAFSAFHELLLHELLFKLNCHITLHPDKDEAHGKRPDFLIKSGDGSNCYIEAVTVTGESKEEKAVSTLIYKLYDFLNTLNIPDFFLSITVRNATRTSPRLKNIKAFLINKLKNLDVDEVIKLREKNNILEPRWVYEDNGWKIIFNPLPKSPKQRGKPLRNLGMISKASFKEDNDYEHIRNALLKKARKYGDFDIPFIIAVNIMGDYIDNDDILDALFGRGDIVIKKGMAGYHSELQRIPNGLWTNRSQPRYTRVSAVLVIIRLSPWNIKDASLCLYHNPWAKVPYNSVLNHLPQAIPNDGVIEYVDGESLATLLNFSDI